MSDLNELARRWIEEHGDVWADQKHYGYSTGENSWLWEAERAFCEELAAWRDAHLLAVSPEPPKRGFHLYRLWAEDGRLLYVGVSTALSARLRSHRRRWGDLIATVTWEEHQDARSMLAAEREAIADEYPALNKAGV